MRGFFNEGEFELKQFIHGDTARHTGSSLAIDAPTQLNYGDTWTLSDSGLSLDFPIVTAYPVILWQATDNPDYLTSAQLRQFIAYLKEQNTPSEAYAYFLYKRLLLPITVVALVGTGSDICQWTTTQHTHWHTHIFWLDVWFAVSFCAANVGFGEYGVCYGCTAAFGGTNRAVFAGGGNRHASCPLTG